MQAHKGKWGKLNGDKEEENIVSDYYQYGGECIECGKVSLFMIALMIDGSLWNPPGIHSLDSCHCCPVQPACIHNYEKMLLSVFGYFFHSVSRNISGISPNADSEKVQYKKYNKFVASIWVVTVLSTTVYTILFARAALYVRTLEMNNVQDGAWHGRGDTICIGSLSEDSKPYLELSPPFVVSTKSPEFASMQKTSSDSIHFSTSVVGHSSPLVPPLE
ncbi:hypothetical protein DH2020_041801 [Rehmannia glutinosa]|uniref:Uncharacterized protein n=1 Tax=Rehmannia glutinosa TaxID=99300 RepID=A0ABR0UQI9_REHGL